MQSMAEGVLILDEHGVVLSADRVAAALLGYEPENLIGCHSEAFWPEELPLPGQAPAETIRCTNTTLRAQDGRPVPVMLAVTPISGHLTGSLVTLTGLDDVQRLNEALTHTQRLASIGILTASVVHELNTPISIIAASSGSLLREFEDNTLSMEQLMRYAEMIEQSTWRAVRIVEVLRNYSYSEEMQPAVTDLRLIVEDALTLVRRQFQGHYNVTIKTDLSPDLKSIVCDHNRITQVIINLLSNASDAMQPAGGTIHVQTRALPPTAAVPVNGAATNSAAATGDHYAISIRDEGHGIAPDVMEKLFNPFFTTKRSGKGTGLGLYIARRIVSQHNGRIWAENNPDRGATFTIILPRYQ